MAVDTVDPLLQSWMDQKQKLVTLQGKYQDTHPDIILAKKEVREVEERIRLQDAANLPSSSKMRDDLPAKFQNRFSKTKEISELKSREIRIQQQILEFERRIDNIPKREQELAILLRDYDNTQKNYQMLLDKKLTARISENLEKRQKGERFRILDSANFPEKPYKPDPMKLFIFGCIIGIVGGIFSVFAREMSDSSIKTPEELEALFSVPVIASILDYDSFSQKQDIKSNHRGKSNIPIYVEAQRGKK